MELFDWTKEYVKFKDVIKKENSSVEYEENKILVKTKKSKHIIYFVHEDLTEGLKFIQDKSQKNIILVCMNIRKNVDIVQNNWKDLIQYEKLMIVFAEPNKNLKWVLKPHIHHKIIDEGNLKEGLMSLHKGLNVT